ncbi:hypothetical protein ACWD6P_13490 [Streptomyces sp. NPDC002446]
MMDKPKRRLACTALLLAVVSGPVVLSGTAMADSRPPKPVVKTGLVKAKKGAHQAVAQQSGWKVEQGEQYTRCWEDEERQQSICETVVRWPDGSETVVG